MGDGPKPHAPGSRRSGFDGEAAVVLAASVIFALPIWIGNHPPMVDYPQHLSMASMLRWYNDPLRNLSDVYTLALTRPNTVFFFLAAALSYLVPLAVAGKFLMWLSVVATGMAGLALARRAGRPGWYGLFSLLSAYNYAFFFGFANNVIATPLLLYGIVLADRRLDRPLRPGAWLVLAVYSALFYVVHIQFLFLYVAAVGWLALVRYRGRRNLVGTASALSVGVALALSYHLIHGDKSTFGYHERNIYSDIHAPPLLYDKLMAIPEHLFGGRADDQHWLLFGLAMLAVLVACRASSRPAAEEDRETDARPPLRARVFGTLSRTRFHTLAAWFLFSYFLMPHVFVGVFVYQRLVAVAFLMLPAVLPIPNPGRTRTVKLVLGAALAALSIATADAAHTFHLESRGGHELIAKTSPGKNLMAIMIWMGSTGIQNPPMFLNFGAHYVAEKGGRIFFSFAELRIAPVQLPPELEFEDQYAGMNEWQPRRFRFADFGYHYDYFLCRGNFDWLKRIFGKHLSRLAWEVRDDWILLWRKPL